MVAEHERHETRLEMMVRAAWSALGVATLLLFAGPAHTQEAPPLDPIIGDTGRPLSDVAKKADVRRYELDLEIFPSEKRMSGTGRTEFALLEPTSKLELKLDSRFVIHAIEVDGEPATYQRESGVLTIDLPEERPAGSEATVTVHYSGTPHVAINAPWAGGTVWGETPGCRPWIATAVQGEGCDLFWPCKDHFIDKADSMRIRLTVPDGLVAVTNGVLQQVTPLDGGRQEFDWLLSVPASDYNIALNIAPYERIRDSYTSINGETVPIEFWVLPEHADQARRLLNDDIRSQLAFFERRLGPYPWGKDKIGFVETPHLGMEHQTIIAYGKGYKRDTFGFDWLAQHELSHEWFGNLITHERLNDAWLHEGFGAYMQPAYARDTLGDAAYRYQMYKAYLGLRNCDPVVRKGSVTSNEAFSSDIYGKGSWTLHTLRWLIGDDAFWNATRELLYGTSDTAHLGYPLWPRYRSTADFVAIVNRVTGKDYSWLFDVYLYEAELPELVAERTGDALTLRWKVPHDKPFPMPVPVSVNGVTRVIEFDEGQAAIGVGADDTVLIDPDMNVLRRLPFIGDCEEIRSERARRDR